MAVETRSPSHLTELIRGARCVLFDFDGPICRLFAGLSARQVARDQERWLAGQGMRETLHEWEWAKGDPHAVLIRLASQQGNSELVRELERRLTEQELLAVPGAGPTQHADALIRAWSAMGVRLAITTNNSPSAVRSYLRHWSLDGCFEPHVYGRDPEALDRLKPDPYQLKRALDAVGAAPAETLMIGDAPTDLAAARAAGVAFLGYARNERKDLLLREAGAGQVVGSMEQILTVLRGLR
ncbi:MULTISPECIES: HAD family hydrolase [unclassified Streptomyces]|uniref:HAD family hydrolase n=1 Tax=unclassified Streptomyces TaxID=2593676 RepID=UPI00278BFD56|nr:MULTISPECIES: HAD family hydrolase [unclassified Streptomyces]